MVLAKPQTVASCSGSKAAEGNAFIEIQGEDYAYTNDSSIHAVMEYDTRILPYEVKDTVLNILDSDSFDTAGQCVSYSFEITADPNAIDVLGTPARDLGWWTDNTAGYELAEGATLTMKLNNYSCAANNWSNHVLGFVNTAVITTSLTAEAPCFVFVGGEGAYIELLSVN